MGRNVLLKLFFTGNTRVVKAFPNLILSNLALKGKNLCYGRIVIPSREEPIEARVDCLGSDLFC